MPYVPSLYYSGFTPLYYAYKSGNTYLFQSVLRRVSLDMEKGVRGAEYHPVLDCAVQDAAITGDLSMLRPLLNMARRKLTVKRYDTFKIPITRFATHNFSSFVSFPILKALTDRLENLAGDDDPVTDAVFAAIPSDQVNTRFLDGFEGYTEDTTTALIDVVKTGEFKVCMYLYVY